MTFTNDLSTAIGQMRYHLGDDVSGAGVKPDGTNFTDEQLTYALSNNGQNVKAAAAEVCGVLATRWAVVPDKVSTDSGAIVIDRTQRVNHWLALQKQLQQQAAGNGSNFVMATLDRRDAFSVTTESGGGDLLRSEDTTYTDGER